MTHKTLFQLVALIVMGASGLLIGLLGNLSVKTQMACGFFGCISIGLLVLLIIELIINYKKKIIMDKDNISLVFLKAGFPTGRLISYSRTTYLRKYPDNDVYFNANIVIKKYGKIWYGDLDITRDSEHLKNVANSVGEDLYILREMDARFENENLPFSEYQKRAVAVISSNSK